MMADAGVSREPLPSTSRHLPTVFAAGVASERPEIGSLAAPTLQALEWQRHLTENLRVCRSAIRQQGYWHYLLKKTTSADTNYMFVLESGLFDMATSGLSEGCFYSVAFRKAGQPDVYVRFFESGIFSGFFGSKGLDLLLSSFRITEDNQLFWENVFTEEDIKKREAGYQSSLDHKRTKLDPNRKEKLPVSGRRYISLLKKNKLGIVNALEHLLMHVQTDIFKENFVECLGVLVCVEKKKSFRYKDCENYFSASKFFRSMEFQPAFNTFRTEGLVEKLGSLNFLSPLQPPVSWNQQLKFISSISNFHKWQHDKINYSQWLSHYTRDQKYKPASLRNQILFNFRDGNLKMVHDTCAKYLNLEQEVRQSSSQRGGSVVSTMIGSEDVEITHPVPKRQRVNTRKRLTMSNLQAKITTFDPRFTSRNLAQNTSPFDSFKFAMIENGNMFWRRSSANVDIFTMNDVSMTTGLFQEDCFVHLTRVSIEGEFELTCSCSMYATLMQVASIGVSDVEFDEMDLQNINCCHMKLLNELVVDHMPSIISNTSNSENNLVRKLELGKDLVNAPVCYLPTSSSRTLKFSVYSDHDNRCAFVHITDNRICCQSGYCDALFSCSKRSIITLDKAEAPCPHLISMREHPEVWSGLLPVPVESIDTDVSNETEDDPEDVYQPPPPNVPDSEPDLQAHRFNEVTGLWEYPSLSKHVPSDDGSPSLQNSLQLRNTFSDLTFGRDGEGYLRTDGHILMVDSFPETCQCGAGYSRNGVTNTVVHTATVYMSHGPAKYKIYIGQCYGKSRLCDIGPGRQQNIHFLTRETGAGDEIGWDFIDHVLNSYITFGAYCNMMNNRYRRVYSGTASFMSSNTFIAWWFSWISKFNIDFRQPCKLCKYNPRYLAADGTKIGINVSHSTVTPIEEPTVDTLIDPCHRRNNRAFISYSQGDQDAKEKSKSRDHLLYHCKRSLGTLGRNDELPLEEEIVLNEKLYEHVDEGFLPLIKIFVQNQCGNRLHRKLAVLFKILSTNHSLSSVLPFRYIEDFQSILAAWRLDNNVDIYVLNKMSQISPEIRNIIIASNGTAVVSDIIIFLEHLAKRVLAIFTGCKEPDLVCPKPGSYNPAKFGRAYYFTAHGQQVRDIPNYTMGSRSSSNYDDEPAREADKCFKKFPEVGRKGTTYLFLWFDPQHYGHCYGYHMIPGHEGRKDPACSAYAFLETAPAEMFYDFSCQLEEYCLNREPGYWKNTRFFHDTFHGFSHSCPAVYKSSRLMLLQKVNTEICEQTNAFLQRIKYSARAMSMSKFNHFLQFFLYQWSGKKYENFQRKCALATTYTT